MLTYLDAFSPNVQEVWSTFKFAELLAKLEENNVLWGVLVGKILILVVVYHMK